MSDQKQNEAFKPLTRESGHLDIESRLAERAKNKELWVHLWRKYPELIPARDLMSGLLLSYSTLFPNCYFLPDDEIQFLVEYADLADSIDQIEFYVDLELLFEVKIYDQFTRDTFRHPYHLFLAKLLNLVKADNPSHYLAQKVFDPITYQTKGIEKRNRLRL